MSREHSPSTSSCASAGGDGDRPELPEVGAVALGLDRSRAAQVGIAGLGLLAIGALVWFDLSPPLAVNDDWTYAWTAAHLAPGRLRLYPGQSAYALAHIVWGAVWSHLWRDPRAYRLSTIGFVALAAGASFSLARRLGARPPWALFGALSLVCWPLFFNLSVSFMSDVPYTALVLASAWAALRWLVDGKSPAPFLVLAVLTVLERQLGIALLAAPLLHLRSRPRPWPRRHLFQVGLVVAVTLGAVALPALAGLAPPTQANRVSGLTQLGPAMALRLVSLLSVANPLGLALIPFVVPLGLGVRAAVGRPRRRLTYAAGIAAAVSTLILFGNVWTPVGFGPITNLGLKPSPWGSLFPVICLAGAVAVFSLVGVRGPELLGLLRVPTARLLMVVAGAQALLTIAVLPIALDRYWLPVVACILPLAAAVVSELDRGGRFVSWGAGLGLGLGLAISLVGEQDFLAWHLARERAAAMAYRRAPAAEVSAGYETNAVHVEIPNFERGHEISALARPGVRDPTILGPLHPRLQLLFAPSADPRPGVRYRSTASGKIVIAPG